MSTFPISADFPRYLLSDIGLRFAPRVFTPLAALPRSNQLHQQKATTAMVADCVYTCSDFVTDGCVLSHLLNANVVSAVRLAHGRAEDEKALLFQLLLLLVTHREEVEHILAYLASAEQAEPDVWARDDYRIAWLTVLYCANSRPTPWAWAFNQVVGGHPSKVIPQLVERARKHAVLGLPPKKSAASIRSTPALKEKTL